MVTPIVVGALGIEIRGEKKDHSDYSIVENSLNIEMNPGDLRKFTVT